MMALDATKVVTNIRDHLSRHDRPIAFLFGAGTTAAVKIPAAGSALMEPVVPPIAKLTELCRDTVSGVDKRFAKAWDGLAADSVGEGQGSHVEALLTRVRTAVSALGKSGVLHGLDRDGYVALEKEICRKIGSMANADLSALPKKIAHDSFAQWVGRANRNAAIEIFTLNYDVLIERSLELARVAVFDGFVGVHEPFFSSDAMRRSEIMPGSAWTRLWKLHGSVSWRRSKGGLDSRVIRTQANGDGEMILPSASKYDESRQQPYLAYLDRLGRFLDQDDALLVCCGYSFGDQHVNSVIFSALANRPRAHLFAINFEDSKDDDVLADRAKGQRNVVVIGPNSGIVACQRGEWTAQQSRCESEGISSSVVTCAADGGAAGAKIGLGDFAVFAGFLESLLPGSDGFKA